MAVLSLADLAQRVEELRHERRLIAHEGPMDADGGVVDPTTCTSVPTTTSVPSPPRPTVTDTTVLRSVTSSTTLAKERLLPIDTRLESVLPFGGLPRGSVAEIDHIGLLCVALRESMAVGHWAAALAMPTLGLAAAAECGVVLERFAVVRKPPVEQAASVVAALIDAVDLLIVGPGVVVKLADARRLSARLRERGGVLFSFGAWPEAPSLRLTVASSAWSGAEHGHGYLSSWGPDVEVVGRGAAARPRRTTLQLGAPSHEGAADEQHALREVRQLGVEQLEHAG